MSAPRIPVPTPFQLWYLAWEQLFYRAFSYGKHAAYPPREEGIPRRLLAAGNPTHPRFTLKRPLDSPSPRLRLVTPDAIAYIRSPVESSMRTNVLILGTNQSGTTGGMS